jgi:hypothetical protein
MVSFKPELAKSESREARGGGPDHSYPAGSAYASNPGGYQAQPGATRPATLYSYDSPRVPTRHISSASRSSLYNTHDTGNGYGLANDPYSNNSNAHSNASFPNPYDDSQDFPADDDDADSIAPSSSFTYIPPAPRKFYKHLLSMCLYADLALMMSPEVDDNDEVSLGILSSPHLDLLNECAVRWRVDHPYRYALHATRSFYI